MKKKIKDLTIIEAIEYCYKKGYCDGSCPCRNDDDRCIFHFITLHSKINQQFKNVLEKEIETNESDND